MTVMTTNKMMIERATQMLKFVSGHAIIVSNNEVTCYEGI